MNLDLFPLGWVHLIASLVAVALAAVMLARAKGTPAHKRRGRMFAAAILVTSVTALGIYRLGVFFFPHWFAIASLVTTAAGVAVAHVKRPRAGWVQIHLTCMLTSVYILVGGGVNEVYLRVDFLHRLTPDLTSSPLVGRTHFVVFVSFLIAIIYFIAKTLRSGPPTIAGADDAAAAHEPRSAAGG